MLINNTLALCTRDSVGVSPILAECLCYVLEVKYLRAKNYLTFISTSNCIIIFCWQR